MPSSHCSQRLHEGSPCTLTESGSAFPTPAGASRGGVVYLRGAVTAPAGSPFNFSLLPAAARPAHNLYLQKNLALENGWVSSQSAYNTGNPAYAVKGGVVYLSGSMHGSGKSKLAFVLPKAARPAKDLYISEYAFDSSTGWLQILPTGQVYVNGATSDEYISLGNISFPVASAKWTYFKLMAPWQTSASQAHTSSPAYTVINGIVYLTGSMREPTAGTGFWVRLPAAARTKADVLEIETDTAGGTAGAIAITDSLGLVSSNPFANARRLTSLSAIAYPQNS